MKVLEDKDYFKKDCPKCGNKLGIYIDDIQVMGARSDFVNCSVCGVAIQILSDEIPKHWKSKLYPNAHQKETTMVTFTEEEGINAIIKLQGYVDVVESTEKAKAGWNAMSDSEKESTEKYTI